MKAYINPCSRAIQAFSLQPRSDNVGAVFKSQSCRSVPLEDPKPHPYCRGQIFGFGSVDYSRASGGGANAMESSLRPRCSVESRLRGRLSDPELTHCFLFCSGRLALAIAGRHNRQFHYRQTEPVSWRSAGGKQKCCSGPMGHTLRSRRPQDFRKHE